MEEQLVQEVERLKAKVEPGKLSVSREVQRVSTSPQTDQATCGAAARVGDRDVGPRKQGV